MIIVQLAVLHHASDMSPDPFLRWSFALCTQFIEYLSIVSACALYLRPFLQNAASGMLGHTPQGNRTRHYYHEFDKIRIMKTQTVTITSEDPRLRAFKQMQSQDAKSTMNITVQKDFEVHEDVAGPLSAASSQDDRVIIEQISAL